MAIAQAMIEKGALDGLAAGLVTVADHAQYAFTEYPWLFIAGIVAFLVIVLRRGN